MSRIVVFGAAGRAGRRAVAEAVARGHRVTAVVRDPAAHPELAGPGVETVAGDVLSPDAVAALAAGHDAVVQAAYQQDLPSGEFFPAAARSLLDGLARAGVARLVVVGIGTTLDAEPGVPVHDSPGFPPEAREFSLGHLAELAVLRDADTEVDWLVLAPPPAFLDDTADHGRPYRTAVGTVVAPDPDAPAFGYADLARALLDEIDTPAHHRALLAVA